jgi:transposase-like protein
MPDGQRESKESWARVLGDLCARGLTLWRATVADGHLGIWTALAKVFPQAEELRCWNHRIMNAIDQLPKKLWGRGAGAAQSDCVCRVC